MRLTERQIKDIIRRELSEASGIERLDEFKAIKDALTQIFKAFGALLFSGFSSAKSTYDPSRFKVNYNNPGAGRSADKLEPKTDAYDQVYALSRVLFHIDGAIEFGLSYTARGLDSLKKLEFPVEAEDEKFTENLNYASEQISGGAGVFSEYLSKSGSSKVSDIGAALEPASDLTGTLENFAKAVSSLESLNPVSDWENILKSKAVQKVLDSEGEKSESMKNLINETKGANMQNIPKLSELKTALDEANAIAVQAEEVVNFAADEAGEAPEESELLDHHDKMLRKMVRGILS